MIIRGKGPLDDRLDELIKGGGGGAIHNHRNGYRSLIAHLGILYFPSVIGNGTDMLAYIELPMGHPDIGKRYDDLSPAVNGGLTYGKGRVFGWDYNHAYNDLNVQAHIRDAIEYFRGRE